MALGPGNKKINVGMNAESERKAFETLFQRLSTRVFGYARSLCGDGTFAEDLTQEAFAAYLRASRKGSNVENPVAYLLQTVRHLYLKSERQRQRSQSKGDFLESLFEVSDQSVKNNLDSEKLTEALNRIPEEQKEAILLHIYNDLTFEDGAKIAGVPQGTFTKRYYSGLERLQDILKRSKA